MERIVLGQYVGKGIVKEVDPRDLSVYGMREELSASHDIEKDIGAKLDIAWM